MTPSLRRKLEALAERREELERLLADPGVAADNARFRDLSREFAQLEPVASALAAEARAKADLAAAEAMRGDPELGELAEEEVTAARERRPSRDFGEAVRDGSLQMTNFGDLRYTAWGGGVPILYEGQVVGAVGVSGLPEEEDMVLAAMGAALLGESIH